MEKSIEKIIDNSVCYEDIVIKSNFITRNDLRLIIPWNFNFTDSIEQDKKTEILKILKNYHS